jgi:SNF2 family DNA or RNA helicase
MSTEDIQVTLYPTGWQTALTRPPKLRVNSWSPSAERVEVTTLRPKEKRPPKIFSIAFGNSSWLELKSNEAPRDAAQTDAAAKLFAQAQKQTQSASVPDAAKREEQNTSASATVTRIRPPKDAIRLEDRLYYLLQPPLETLLSSEALTFPFKPFPYQFAGIAFLYARHSAILADEMGLGKTMQAITTIRMLLHAGEVRSVLMICPKPLVSNWRREFGLWDSEFQLSILVV